MSGLISFSNVTKAPDKGLSNANLPQPYTLDLRAG